MIEQGKELWKGMGIPSLLSHRVTWPAIANKGTHGLQSSRLIVRPYGEYLGLCQQVRHYEAHIFLMSLARLEGPGTADKLFYHLPFPSKSGPEIYSIICCYFRIQRFVTTAIL